MRDRYRQRCRIVGRADFKQGEEDRFAALLGDALCQRPGLRSRTGHQDATTQQGLIHEQTASDARMASAP